MSMRFLFACGGTAGHINPALSVAAVLQRMAPDVKILFAGAGRELENRLVPRAGYELVNIKMSGLKRSLSPDGIVHNVKTFRNLSAANAHAAAIIREFNPDAVVGTGGYICYPVLKTAAKAGIPTFVHESNAEPGLTTKLLSKNVDRVLVAFPGLEGKYRKPERVIFTGTPVRNDFVVRSGTPERKTNGKDPQVVSFWGSLGAGRMNEIMVDFINLNIRQRQFLHIHAAGNKESLELMRKRLKTLGAPDTLPQGIEVREYIDDMPDVMAEADIVLCRAGGSTIGELTAIGKPAILVPSPYVTNNQQLKNASQVQKAGGAVMIPEKDCTGDILFDTVSSILSDRGRLASMSAAQKALGIPDSAAKIAEIIISYCRN